MVATFNHTARVSNYWTRGSFEPKSGNTTPSIRDSPSIKVFTFFLLRHGVTHFDSFLTIIYLGGQHALRQSAWPSKIGRSTEFCESVSHVSPQSKATYTVGKTRRTLLAP